MKLHLLKQDTYVYSTYNEQLGLTYVGKHVGTWADHNGNDGYKGSSAYLKAVMAEFSEYHFEKTLIAQFDNDLDATTCETDLINHLHEIDPAGCLNRSPNDGTNQWLHEGYGTMTDPVLMQRLDKARKVVRPGTIKDGDYKCLVLYKKPDGKAHPPFIPGNDRTPFRDRPKYWSAAMLAEYDAAPTGGLHFFCKVHVSGRKDNGKQYENYEVLALIESGMTELAARECGSYHSKLGSIEYKEKMDLILKERQEKS